MKTFLLEIGTEELPARLLSPGLAQLAQRAEALFAEARIEHGNIQTYGTPRRMALLVDLAPTQAQELKQVRGPAVGVAFDEAGNPTRAAMGFAKSQGLSVEELQRRETETGTYVYAVKELLGEATEQILPKLLTRLVGSLTFPHTMRWGEREERFPRPVRWLVALWGTEVVEFSWAGVDSGRLSRGHRFLSTGLLRLEQAQDYLPKLQANYVLADPAQRREEIQRGLVEEAEKLGGQVLMDPGLLEEVNNLVEYPTVFKGSFDPEYLKLPQEAIITPMRDHQRYFPVVDGAGKLLPAFLAVRNGTAESIQTVARGNERVLLARLEDARFFFQVDSQVPLCARVEKLKEMVYHEKLGSLWEKTQRLEKLVAWLGKELSLEESIQIAQRAALLSKADLTTSMVGEFSELQGIMGREYALLSGESQEVAQAIAQQYRPRFAGDELPSSLPGALVALADKIDTIVGCFSVGLIPTGSEDPYALRRAALGILAILSANKFSLELRELLEYAQSLYGEGRQTEELLEFFWGRLRGIFHEEGWPHGLISAVLAAPSSNVLSLQARGEAIRALAGEAQFENLLVAYNRAANLAQKAAGDSVSEALFVEPQEEALWAAYGNAKGIVTEGTEAGDWSGVLGALSTLRGPLDAFFEAVMVMAKEDDLRENRLSMLRAITELFAAIADFRLLEV